MNIWRIFKSFKTYFNLFKITLRTCFCLLCFFDENKIWVIGLVPEAIEWEYDVTCLAYVSFVVLAWSDLIGIPQFLLEWMFKGFKIKSEECIIIEK